MNFQNWILINVIYLLRCYLNEFFSEKIFKEKEAEFEAEAKKKKVTLMSGKKNYFQSLEQMVQPLLI